MIGRCFINSQHGRPVRHPANVGYSFSGIRMTIYGTKPTKDANTKHGQGKAINLTYAAILGGTERSRKGSRCRAELIYIDQHILNERKTRWKNLAMVWTDN